MKVYPVVHVQSPEQAVEQTRVAVDAGADGVFLINHGMATGHDLMSDPLIDAFNDVTDTFGDLYVGINYLSYDPLSGYEYTQKLLDQHAIHRAPDALWFDDATDRIINVDTAKKYLGELKHLRDDDPRLQAIRFLGGVSFKYTSTYSEDPVKSAQLAAEYAPYIDVVTTSGAGTGSAPSSQKISAMKHAITGRTLAVASGVSEHNIQSYNGDIDEVLIASSLETGTYSGIFIPERVKRFVAAAHGQHGVSADSVK